MTTSSAKFRLLSFAIVVWVGLLVTGVKHVEAQQQLELSSQALGLLDKVIDRESSSYPDIVNWIARVHCNQRKFDAAIALTKNLKKTNQTEVLGLIARRAFELGDSKAGNQALTLSYDLLPTEYDPSDFWIAPLLVELAIKHDVALAAKLVNKAEDGRFKTKSLLMIARYYVQALKRDQAIEFLDQVKQQLSLADPDDKFDYDDLVLDCASVAIGLNDPTYAASFVKRAREVISKDSSDERHLKGLASLVGQTGQFLESMSFIESLPDDAKIDPMISLAVAMRARGDESGALSLMFAARELAGKLDNYPSPYWPLVTGFLKLGRIEEAITLLPRIESTYELQLASIEVASWLRDRKRSDEAVKILDLVTTRAKAIVSEKSEDIPAKASYSHVQQKSQTLSALVEEYLEYGELKAAEEAANAMDQPNYRAEALSSVGVRYAKTGNQHDAQRVLNVALELVTNSPKYGHDRYKQYALIAVAKGFAATGGKEQLNKVVTCFLTEIIDQSSPEQNLPLLYEMGTAVESSGAQLSKRNQSLLKKYVAEVEDNN